MGGYGSGRWHRRQRRKGTVERWMSIDASMFRHQIKEVIGDKDLSIDAGIRVERQIPFVISRERYPLLYPVRFLLEYTITLPENHPIFVVRSVNTTPLRQAIRFQSTTPFFGGERWWFTCPHCKRRVRLLYRFPVPRSAGSRPAAGRSPAHIPPIFLPFLCRGRDCYNLSYLSQKSNQFSNFPPI